MENVTDTMTGGEMPGNPIVVNPESIAYFTTIRKWTKFLAIVGFVTMGLLVVFSLFMGSMFNNMPGMQNSPFHFGYLFTVLYLIFGLIYFFPLLYLMRFSTTMKTALQLNDTNAFTASVGQLKSFFNYIGILTVVMLSLYALVLVIMLFAGLFVASIVHH